MIIHPPRESGLLRDTGNSHARYIERELDMSFADLRSSIELVRYDAEQLEDFLDVALYGATCRCPSCRTLAR